MKTYPSIDKAIRPGIAIYAFDKLDGSNMRAEWRRKQGFYKFGRREGLLDDTNPILRRAEPLFMEKYSEDLGRIFADQRWEQVVVFSEFWGPRSFAGIHHPDDEQTVTMFDVSVYKKGMMEPAPYLKLFDGKVDIARCLYRGNANADFVEAVQTGTLEGMAFEGVVCKGAWDRKAGMPLMFKVKNRAWLERLKKHCGDDDALFQRLL